MMWLPIPLLTSFPVTLSYSAPWCLSLSDAARACAGQLFPQISAWLTLSPATGLGSNVIFSMRPIITPPFKTDCCAFWHFWWSLCCSNLFFHEFLSWLTYCVLCSYVMCIFIIAPISSTQNVSSMRSGIFVLLTDVSQGPKTESQTSFMVNKYCWLIE